MRLARIAAAIALAAVVGAQSAAAAAPKPASQVSRNWAGYALTGSRFTKVTATWTQPNVRCGSGDRGARFSVWVGIGGYENGPEGLQQTGVSSDCSPVDNRPEFYAWYEVTPAPGVRVHNYPVRAGDTITATVALERGQRSVAFRLVNHTRRWSFATSLASPEADLTSAEWIAEAPMGCNAVRCGSQRLADFGSVRMNRIGVVGDGHAGGILDRRWHAVAVHQEVSERHAYRTGSAAGAAPRALASDGGAFTLFWRANALARESRPQQPAAKPVDPLIAGPLERVR